MTSEELYEKYPHIIRGSIEGVPRKKIIIGGKDNKIVSHGRIAIINCTTMAAPSCLKTRIINVQDADQTKYCTACTRRRRNARRRARRRQLKNQGR